MFTPIIRILTEKHQQAINLFITHFQLTQQNHIQNNTKPNENEPTIFEQDQSSVISHVHHLQLHSEIDNMENMEEEKNKYIDDSKIELYSSHSCEGCCKLRKEDELEISETVDKIGFRVEEEIKFGSENIERVYTELKEDINKYERWEIEENVENEFYNVNNSLGHETQHINNTQHSSTQFFNSNIRTELSLFLNTEHNNQHNSQNPTQSIHPVKENSQLAHARIHKKIKAPSKWGNKTEHFLPSISPKKQELEDSFARESSKWREPIGKNNHNFSLHSNVVNYNQNCIQNVDSKLPKLGQQRKEEIGRCEILKKENRRSKTYNLREETKVAKQSPKRSQNRPNCELNDMYEKKKALKYKLTKLNQELNQLAKETDIKQDSKTESILLNKRIRNHKSLLNPDNCSELEKSRKAISFIERMKRECKERKKSYEKCMKKEVELNQEESSPACCCPKCVIRLRANKIDKKY